MMFRDRRDAGDRLAARLAEYANRSDVLVLALPRGGVPVGFAVARALAAPLDVFLVRKLGVPGYEELAMGAVASGGGLVLNARVVNRLGVSDSAIAEIAQRERREIARQQERYLRGRQHHRIEGRQVILVDDGLATGTTMRAALEAVRSMGPRRIVAAVPVGAGETCRELEEIADEVVCLMKPHDFHAVGVWYQDFSPTSDEHVVELLDEASKFERTATHSVSSD